uniref:Uncharacterized protein n=1 Tax=Rhizophora mucronata TaxID=61149 RepID=A0A2P2LKN5_RHIMU
MIPSFSLPSFRKRNSDYKNGSPNLQPPKKNPLKNREDRSPIYSIDKTKKRVLKVLLERRKFSKLSTQIRSNPTNSL